MGAHVARRTESCPQPPHVPRLVPLELGTITPIFYAFREHEELQAVIEETAGGRLHYMVNRIGGLKDDVPAGWLDRAAASVATVRRRMPELESFIVGNPILNHRTAGIVVITPEMVNAYGISGPNARASGL